MDKLEIYVCSNMFPEIKKALASLSFSNVHLIEFPCTCIAKETYPICKEIFKNNENTNYDKIIICSKTCNILKFIYSENISYHVTTMNSCFEYLLHSSILDNLTQDGAYLISYGWLINWKKNIEKMGFNQDTAIMFFKEFSNKIVFLNAQIDEKIVTELQAFADYIKLPYQVITINLKYLSLFIENIILKWHFNKANEKAADLNFLRNENANYATMLDIIKKFSNTKTKKSIISEIKNLLTLILGANVCEYTEELEHLPLEFKPGEKLLFDSSQQYLILENNEGFYVKLLYFDQPLALIKVSNFLFPEYLLKYLDFTSSIVQICSIALQNAAHIEALEQHKYVLNYISIHDTLTNLYNRSYFNDIIEDVKNSEKWVLFICDIDGLKFVNDNFGHNEGDDLIIKVAEILKTCFRKTDIIARIGGDEFGIIVKDSNDILAEKLKTRFYQLLDNFNHEKDWTVHASLGYVCGNKKAPLAEIIKAADDAMYIEKQLYKNSL